METTFMNGAPQRANVTPPKTELTPAQKGALTKAANKEKEELSKSTVFDKAKSYSTQRSVNGVVYVQGGKKYNLQGKPV